VDGDAAPGLPDGGSDVDSTAQDSGPSNLDASLDSSVGDSSSGDARLDSPLADSSSPDEGGSAMDAAPEADGSPMAGDSGSDAGPLDAGATVATYLGTQPPGDVWTWVLDHGAGTFSAGDLTTGYTYAGTLAQVTGTRIVGNGFTKLSIASTTDPAAAGWTKQEAFAVEFPGVALLVSPPGPAATGNNGNGYYSKLIVASAVGTCPTAGGTFNTIVVPRSGWENQASVLTVGQSITGPGYGTAVLGVSGGSYTVGGSTAQVTFTYTAAGYTMDAAVTSSGPTNTYGCDGGQLTSATAGTPTVGVTPAGVLIEDMGGTDPNISGLIGVRQTTVPSLAALQGDYLGFVFAWSDSILTPYTIAVSCSPGSSPDAGNEICQPYDSLDPVTPSQFGTDAAVTLPVFFDAPGAPNGMFLGHSAAVHNGVWGFDQAAYMVTQIGGKGVIVGINGSGTAPALQDSMFIQQ
jgi:hypothetical protein